MSSATKIVGEQLAIAFPDLSLIDQNQEMKNKEAVSEESCQSHGGICAICLDKIVLQETALVKACEHAYWINDYMFEESVCLLLRATWFKPLIVEEREEGVKKPDLSNDHPVPRILPPHRLQVSPRRKKFRKVRWGEASSDA
ncbi:Detected protein of confused Function [Hibiscus syriacus]|uniref:Detected protein of confused Function n=1 Tax=Hibiscus syriacus TaxID=106335 RepID=A0A6A3D4G3_HIBSY|nr:Detected protein of confused Function [Hibiscus syriacus]